MQIMVPFRYTEFIDDLTTQVQNKVIPMSRIDDAVYRILRVKFTMGLFENPYPDSSLAGELGKQVSSYTPHACFRTRTLDMATDDGSTRALAGTPGTGARSRQEIPCSPEERQVLLRSVAAPPEEGRQDPGRRQPRQRPGQPVRGVDDHVARKQRQHHCR